MKPNQSYEKITFDQCKFAGQLCKTFNYGEIKANEMVQKLKDDVSPITVGDATATISYLYGLRDGLRLLIDNIDDCIQKEGLYELSELELDMKLKRLMKALEEAVDKHVTRG